MKIIKICPQCENPFEGRANKVYCSNKCKMDAFYNGNKTDKSVIPADKPLIYETDKRFLLTRDKSAENLVPVSVMFAPDEKETIDNQASACGVGISQYVRVRSLMQETDISGMENRIQKQQKELQDLKIKLNFFNNRKNSAQQAHEESNGKSGLFIEMNPDLLEFLKDAYIEESESFDEDNADDLRDERANNPVAFEQSMGDQIIMSALYQMIDNIAEETGAEHRDVKQRIIGKYFSLKSANSLDPDE